MSNGGLEPELWSVLWSQHRTRVGDRLETLNDPVSTRVEDRLGTLYDAVNTMLSLVYYIISYRISL